MTNYLENLLTLEKCSKRLRAYLYQLFALQETEKLCLANKKGLIDKMNDLLLILWLYLEEEDLKLLYK